MWCCKQARFHVSISYFVFIFLLVFHAFIFHHVVLGESDHTSPTYFQIFSPTFYSSTTHTQIQQQQSFHKNILMYVFTSATYSKFQSDTCKNTILMTNQTTTNWSHLLSMGHVIDITRSACPRPCLFNRARLRMSHCTVLTAG